jgi:hypothetical protein
MGTSLSTTDGVVVHGVRVTPAQYNGWKSQVPADVRRIIAGPSPSGTVPPKVLYAQIALTYEYVNVLTPSQRTYVAKSIRDAENVRSGLQGFFDHKLTKVAMGVYYLFNPLSLLLRPFRKYIAKAIKPLGDAAARGVSNLDPVRAVYWRNAIGLAWGPLNTRVAMLLGSLAIGAAGDEAGFDFGDLLDGISDGLAGLAHLAASALSTPSPYAYSPW